MKKIADWPEYKICKHPDHNPPTMIVLPPGIYEHECPACHQKQTVIVRPKAELYDTSKDWDDGYDDSTN